MSHIYKLPDSVDVTDSIWRFFMLSSLTYWGDINIFVKTITASCFNVITKLLLYILCIIGDGNQNTIFRITTWTGGSHAHFCCFLGPMT